MEKSAKMARFCGPKKPSVYCKWRKLPKFPNFGHFYRFFWHQWKSVYKIVPSGPIISSNILTFLPDNKKCFYTKNPQKVKFSSNCGRFAHNPELISSNISTFSFLPQKWPKMENSDNFLFYFTLSHLRFIDP